MGLLSAAVRVGAGLVDDVARAGGRALSGGSGKKAAVVAGAAAADLAVLPALENAGVLRAPHVIRNTGTAFSGEAGAIFGGSTAAAGAEAAKAAISEALKRTLPAEIPGGKDGNDGNAQFWLVLAAIVLAIILITRK